MGTPDPHSSATPREIRDLWRTLGAEYRADAQDRVTAGVTPTKFRKGRTPSMGRVSDRIGRLARVSGRTVEKCIAVYAAAERNPDLFGPVVTYLERSGNIHDAHNRMRRLADLDATSHLAAIDGCFATLVLDPPWEDETVSENQRPPYATLPVEAIAAVPVPGWVGDRAHIYVHAPGPFVRTAIELIERWGFAHKTLLAWHKSRWSQGRYFRTIDEFVVFGTRGGLMLARQDIPNHFEGPVGEHSEKPTAFYELVCAASPAPYGEAFQRRARPGFANLYRRTDLPEAAE